MSPIFLPRKSALNVGGDDRLAAVELHAQDPGRGVMEYREDRLVGERLRGGVLGQDLVTDLQRLDGAGGPLA